MRSDAVPAALGDLDVDHPQHADIDRERHLGRQRGHLRDLVAIDPAAGVYLDADRDQPPEISAEPRNSSRPATWSFVSAMLTSTSAM